MEPLFSAQYCRIFLHRTTHQAIEIQWLDFVPSADLRAALQELMQLARQHRVLALIADNRLLRAIRPADLAWSGDLVFKGLSKLGGRRFAAVESLDAMNRMGVTALLATVIPDTKLTSHIFYCHRGGPCLGYRAVLSASPAPPALPPYLPALRPRARPQITVAGLRRQRRFSGGDDPGVRLCSRAPSKGVAG